MSDKYVFSTLSSSVQYVNYKQGDSDLPVADGYVQINGGAGIADKRLITPLGVMTKITDEEYDFLKKDELFQRHVKNGFITVRDAKADADVVAADMTSRDPSDPLQDADLGKDTNGNPMTAKVGTDLPVKKKK